MSSFVLHQFKVSCTKESIGIIENIDKVSKKKINKLTDKYTIEFKVIPGPGIGPNNMDYAEIKNWLKEHPTIISKKSIYNLKKCIKDNSNYVITTNKSSDTCYGKITTINTGNVEGLGIIIQFDYISKNDSFNYEILFEGNKIFHAGEQYFLV